MGWRFLRSWLTSTHQSLTLLAALTSVSNFQVQLVSYILEGITLESG